MSMFNDRSEVVIVDYLLLHLQYISLCLGLDPTHHRFYDLSKTRLSCVENICLLPFHTPGAADG